MSFERRYLNFSACTFLKILVIHTAPTVCMDGKCIYHKVLYIVPELIKWNMLFMNTRHLSNPFELIR
jgi:hypothetical protein